MNTTNIANQGKKSMFDPKCYELAEYFLNPDATEKMKDELADWIQHHVELWLYDDREGAIEAAQKLNPPATTTEDIKAPKTLFNG